MKTKTIELTRNDLLDILGVTNNNLKAIIKRNQLKQRLKEKGYTYKGKEKHGRSCTYIVEKYTMTNDVESLNNICTGLFHTRKQKEFSNYYLYRLLNLNTAITKELLSRLVDVNRNTITRWDNLMIDNNIMTKDGFFYVRMTIEDDKPVYELTDKFEYNTFRKNKMIISKKNQALRDYIDGKIDKVTYDLINDGATASILATENKFVYKVTKYQLNKAGIDLAKLIKELIIKVYWITITKYFISLS